MNSGLGHLLEDIADTGDADRLSGLVTSYLSEEGFEGFIYTPGPEQGKTDFCSCGEQLLTVYWGNEYNLIDPVSQQARASWLPVSWDAEQLTVQCKGRQSQLFCATVDHGYRRGISVPVRGPMGRLDMFVALSRLSRRDFALRAETWKREFMLIGAYMSATYHSMIAPEERTEASLTRRELECLSWTAHGKTAWEVGKLLQVSERTVQFHIQNACRKLDSVSKHQATLKAVAMGLIQL